MLDIEKLKRRLAGDPERFAYMLQIAPHIEQFSKDYVAHRSKALNLESLASSVHLAANESIKESIKKAEKLGCSPTCRNGCSWCCYLQVSINIDEAILIYKYIQEEKIEIDWEAVKDQSQYGEERWMEMPWKERKCVFLQEGKCSIYENRPLACRKHMVASKEEDCRVCSVTGSGNTMFIIDHRSEIMLNGMMFDVESGPLPTMLIRAKEILGKNLTKRELIRETSKVAEFR